jgi:tetratricopeptide (TPR) repeat protein
MFRRIWIALLLTLTVAGPAGAQGQNRSTGFSISGRVVVPIAGFNDYFEVLLLQNVEQVVAHTYADSNGRYRFANLTRGTYYIAVKLDGFEEVRQRVDVGGGDTIQNIILDFKEEKIIKPPVDFSGDNGDVVDIADLKRKYPARLIADFADADDDIRKGNYLRAQQRLEAILDEAPDFYDAHNAIGTVFQKLSRYRDAESAFKQARDLKPNSAAPLINLGSLYIQEVDSSPNQNSSAARSILDQALDSLEEAVKLNPSASFGFYLLGVAYYKSAFYEDAEDNLKRALEKLPKVPHARLALANVYIRMQEWPEAAAQLTTYLAENPETPDRTQVEAVRAKVMAKAGR